MAEATRRPFSQKFTFLEVPPPLDRITPEDFAKFSAAGNVRVIDVRTQEEYANGFIPGSKNIPLDEFQTEVSLFVQHIKAEREKTPIHVVFVSLQSPDIDEVAAQAFIRAWEDESEKCEVKLPDATSFVHILLGGFFYWINLHKVDPLYVSNVNRGFWDPYLQHPVA